MKVKYQIAIIPSNSGNKYLVYEMLDGIYFYLFEENSENLKISPPKLLTEEDVNEFREEFDFFDENTGDKYSSLDIIFKEVELEI